MQKQRSAEVLNSTEHYRTPVELLQAPDTMSQHHSYAPSTAVTTAP